MRGGILSLSALLSCSHFASFPDEARRDFASSWTCPADRVEVATMRGRPFSPPPPPAEVAADPGRLAAWRAKLDDAARAQQNRTYYVATGCGRTTTYYCTSDDGTSCSGVE